MSTRYLAFFVELKRLGFSGFELEYPFARELSPEEAEAFVHYHPTRNQDGRLRLRAFRFDVAWPEARLAIEIDGGSWRGGRHNRPKGFRRDLEKMNLAALTGWTVLRYVPEDLFKRALRDVAVFFSSK